MFKKSIFSGALCLMGLALLTSTEGVAAVVGTKTTEGSVNFVKDSMANTLIKPGTVAEQVELPSSDYQNTNGDLRIEYLPPLKFGEVKLSALESNYSVLYSQYTENPSGTKNTEYIPAFVQVTDARGTGMGKWKLEVQQTTPFKSGKHELSGTRVYLNEQKIENNLGKESSLTGIKQIAVSGKLPIKEKIGLSTKSEAGIQVLGSKDSVDTSISSNVFKMDYDEKEYGKGNKYGSGGSQAIKPTDRYDGIQLNVPVGESPQDGEFYTADFTWSLSDTY